MEMILKEDHIEHEDLPVISIALKKSKPITFDGVAHHDHTLRFLIVGNGKNRTFNVKIALPVTVRQLSDIFATLSENLLEEPPEESDDKAD